MGAYVNASEMKIQMAYKCAVMLQDLIRPYLLRRLKRDILGNSLPEKEESVLFCPLSSYQRHLYSTFLSSNEVALVLQRAMRPFRAIGIMRKICNHPRLVSKESFAQRDGEEGTTDSGKMEVMKTILTTWYTQGHQVLLFSQTTSMLNIST